MSHLRSCFHRRFELGEYVEIQTVGQRPTAQSSPAPVSKGIAWDQTIGLTRYGAQTRDVSSPPPTVCADRRLTRRLPRCLTLLLGKRRRSVGAIEGRRPGSSWRRRQQKCSTLRGCQVRSPHLQLTHKLPQTLGRRLGHDRLVDAPVHARELGEHGLVLLTVHQLLDVAL
jgi:hypothetical protein